MADVVPPSVGDVQARRPMLEAIMAQTGEAQPRPTDVKATDFHVPTPDGAEVLLRWFVKEGADPGPAVLYLHGGRMISGSVAIYNGPISRYVSDSSVPMLAVDYRLAPEHPIRRGSKIATPASSGSLSTQVNSTSIPVALRLWATAPVVASPPLSRCWLGDRSGPALEHQILIYPMLDDRNTEPDPEIAPFAVWSYDDNVTGWGALLGEAIGGPDVPSYAAPARASDLAGLPACYLEIGRLDIFRDEDLEYAERLGRAGVPVEFHLRPGAPHEFETYAFASDVARRSVADRLRVLRSI